jgi:DNA-binding transcriptional LysR family regulator
MTLDQLRIFVAVAERQHMTRAAVALNLAQSAVSHAVAHLEARHGIGLFDRIGRRIALTEAGQVFLAEARTILAQVEKAELILGEFGTLERGTLSIQASQTIAAYWLPRHLVAFRRAHPRIDIRLTIGNTMQVADAVERGSSELGFVEGAVESRLLVGSPVARDQLVLVVGLEHPWARNPPSEPGDLLRGEWVLRESGSGTRSAFEQALERLGIKPADLTVALELPANEAVRGAVEAGLGATVISASVAAPSIEAGLLHHVPFALPQRPFHVLRHGRHVLSHAATSLLAAFDAPGT